LETYWQLNHTGQNDVCILGLVFIVFHFIYLFVDPISSSDCIASNSSWNVITWSIWQFLTNNIDNSQVIAGCNWIIRFTYALKKKYLHIISLKGTKFLHGIYKKLIIWCHRLHGYVMYKNLDYSVHLLQYQNDKTMKVYLWCLPATKTILLITAILLSDVRLKDAKQPTLLAVFYVVFYHTSFYEFFSFIDCLNILSISA
jgi:hypothetical protein